MPVPYKNKTPNLNPPLTQTKSTPNPSFEKGGEQKQSLFTSSLVKGRIEEGLRLMGIDLLY
jgi:hypothetical protein